MKYKSQQKSKEKIN